jgi:hypothetical protein
MGNISRTPKHTDPLAMATLSITPTASSASNVEEHGLSFMDLPGEVRNKIYTYLFDYGHAIDVTMSKRNKQGNVPSHFKSHFSGISGTSFLRVRK